jgi:hypothetical protein
LVQPRLANQQPRSGEREGFCELVCRRHRDATEVPSLQAYSECIVRGVTHKLGAVPR